MISNSYPISPWIYQQYQHSYTINITPGYSIDIPSIKSRHDHIIFPITWSLLQPDISSPPPEWLPAKLDTGEPSWRWHVALYTSNWLLLSFKYLYVYITLVEVIYNLIQVIDSVDRYFFFFIEPHIVWFYSHNGIILWYGVIWLGHSHLTLNYSAIIGM